MKKNNSLLYTRIGCSSSVILFSMLTAFALWKFRPETKTDVPSEPVLAVNLLTATRTNLVVTVETQGVVTPLRKVKISAQVGGRVIGMPTELKAGDLVQKDQVLVRIDPVDYETALAESKASLARIEAGLEMIEINQKADTERLKLSERSLELSRKEFERAKKLSNEGQAVSIAVVENTEKTLTQAESQVLQLQQSLDQVPSRIQELESELAAAKARIELSELQLARTEIRAPFDGRIIESRVEIGEVLNPGTMIFELSDDSSLEIQVPVTASDLRQWIPFEDGSPSDQGWFPPLKKVPVTLRWSESTQNIEWQGVLDRMVRFDATTRTALLAIRISGGQLLAEQGGLPLTEGMFCQVWIPGKELKNVIPLPREAVTFDNQSYLNVDGRLDTRDVRIAHSRGDLVYISEGIVEGDLVITTRLVAPLEGVKLLDAGEE